VCAVAGGDDTLAGPVAAEPVHGAAQQISDQYAARHQWIRSRFIARYVNARSTELSRALMPGSGVTGRCVRFLGGVSAIAVGQAGVGGGHVATFDVVGL
jgi:hypothetical protein